MKGRTLRGRRFKLRATVNAARQDEAMADQFAERPKSTGEAVSWRRTRRAAAAQRLNRKPR